MKKVFAVLLAVLMVFSFASCDNATQAPSDLETSQVVAYFNNFATKHIFSEINAAMSGESNEISGLNAVYTPASGDAAAKIVFTYTATNHRYNGEIGEGGENKTNHRLVNGNITLTVTGTVSGNTFTGTDFTFAGKDLQLSDDQSGEGYEKLSGITVDINDFNAPFVGGREVMITLTTGEGDSAVTEPTEIAELQGQSANLAASTGSVTVKSNNVTYDFEDIVKLV